MYSFNLGKKAARLAALLTSMLVAEMSYAGLVVYTDEAAWLAAVTNVKTETFEHSPQGKLALGSTDIGLFDITISGVNSCPPSTTTPDCGESFVKIADDLLYRAKNGGRNRISFLEN